MEMQYGHVPGVEKPISRLVQGTVSMDAKRKNAAFKLLDEAFALGCNTFDTAHVYSAGENERTVGKWVNDRRVRERVVIIGKGAHHNVDRKRVTPFDITADLYDSLARFQFDCIDLYLLHRDDPSVPVGPIVEVLNQHKEAGLINAFGGSNWSPKRIQEANDYAAQHGLTPFVASSPQFSLAEQMKEPWEGCISISGPANKPSRDWYQANQMPVFAWSSLAGGFFSGRFTRDNLDTFKKYFDKVCIDSYANEDNFKRLERAQQLAGELGLTVPQIAMAWVMSQPLNIFALVGAASGDEFQANMEALALKLDPQTLAWLNLETDTR
jgi:aryl-alcohol dehydrogenase-like predicted oxidoreductase